MATIQIVLQAINDATKNIYEVADSLEVVSAAQAQAAETARALTDAELAAAQATVDAVAAYAELRQTTADLARDAEVAGAAVRQLAGGELEAANAAVAAGAAFREQDLSILAVARDAAAASAGFRLLTEAEIAAGNAALRDAAEVSTLAASVSRLSGAELEAINSTLAWSAALHQAGDAETETAAKGAGLAASLAGAAAAMRASTAVTQGAARGWGVWGGAIRAARTQIPLFGGLLDGLAPKFMTQIQLWHLAADAVIEVVAVWSGAAVALGAWALAASDAIQEVQRHMQSLHTVSDAFGKTIAPMTGNLERMHNAVRPQVYQIFGDALSVITKRGGELNGVIKQTGQVLDQLAARASLALQSSQMSEFIHNSVNDVRLLGTAFGNLFGILGNLIRMNQGWATVLLQAGTSILGLVERVTSLIIPLGQLLVLGHGFIVWVGLAVTVAVRFGAVIVGWGASIVAAVTDFIGLIGAVRDFIAVYGVIEALSLVNPFVWVGLAAGAIVGLVMVLRSAKDATATWGDSMQTALQNAQSLDAGVKMLGADQAQVGARMAASQDAVAASGVRLSDTSRALAQNMGRGNPLIVAQAQHYQELSAVQKQLAGDQQTYNTRLGDLAKRYGSVAIAEGLLNTAGITMKQMLDKSGAAWAIIQQQVEGAYRGYGAMANQAGVLGNAMQVLDKQQTDQYKSMQKLNQGWDTQISAMTGAMTAFDTVAQGFQTLSSGSAKFSTSLGRLRVTGIDFVKSGIDSLSKSGIALNQAFAQQVGQINSMADSWRSAGLAQNIFRSGLAASIAPLEKYAAGSQEATAQLVGLAQEAGYGGPVSLNALNKYLGITSGMLQNTSGDMKTMQAAAQQATVQEALLSTAMQAQGNYIASQLIGDINSAILAYHGVAQAATAYGQAVAKEGRDSDAAHAARQKLVDDLVASGKAAGDSTAQIAALISKVLGIPKSAAIQLIMTGTGSFSIQGAVTSGKSVPMITQGAPVGVHAARGAYISIGTGPRSDDVLAAVSKGELVVPAHMVAAGAVDHLRGKIPGFAAGGLVLAGNTSVLTGDYAVNSYGQFKAAGVARMEQAMLAAARASGAKFADGGVVGGPSGPVTGQAPYGGLFVQAAVIQGFTGGLEQLRSPLFLLTQAIRQQTQATKDAAAAAGQSTTAAKTAAAKAPAKLTKIQVDENKIAADRANAAMLAGHIKIVEQAIKDTPAKNKAARANEEKVLRELEAALKTANRRTAADEAALRRETIREAKATVAAMRAQIAAINKLLASGSSAVSKSGLWSKLAADEHALAAAQATLAHVLSGGSGGSAGGRGVTATIGRGSLAALQAGEVRAFNAAVATLRGEIAKGGAGSRLAASDLRTLLRRQAAETAQFAKASADQSARNMSHLLALIHAELRTSADKGLNRDAAAQMARLRASLDRLDAAISAAGFRTRGGGGAGRGTPGSSSYSSSQTITDRKAEQALAALLAEARKEYAELRQVCVLLGQIKAEAAPAAQAKAIGPAVAQALNAAGRGAASSKTTRKG